jgi:hypothetical protein
MTQNLVVQSKLKKLICVLYWFVLRTMEKHMLLAGGVYSNSTGNRKYIHQCNVKHKVHECVSETERIDIQLHHVRHKFGCTTQNLCFVYYINSNLHNHNVETLLI